MENHSHAPQCHICMFPYSRFAFVDEFQHRADPKPNRGVKINNTHPSTHRLESHGGKMVRPTHSTATRRTLRGATHEFLVPFHSAPGVPVNAWMQNCRLMNPHLHCGSLSFALIFISNEGKFLNSIYFIIFFPSSLNRHYLLNGRGRPSRVLGQLAWLGGCLKVHSRSGISDKEVLCEVFDRLE